MHSEELKKLETRLSEPISIPVIGRCLQKKAVIALAEDNSPGAVKVLAKAVTRLKDEEIKEIVLDALGKLRNQNCIDAFCQVWTDTRHRDLTNLLVKKGLVASAPVDVRVISALKAKQLQVVTNGGQEIVEPLLSALKDRDTEIANRASECAVAFTNSDVTDYICQKWAKTRDKLLEQIICQGKYTARQPAEIRVISELKVLGKIDLYHWDVITYREEEEIVEFLVKALKDRDTEIAERAKEYALNLYNDAAGDISVIVNGLCKKWSETRDHLLEELVCKSEYLAWYPFELMVLTALKTEELEIIQKSGKKIVEPLLSAFQDKDSEIANRAKECAISLTNPEAIDYICNTWSKTRDKLLEQLICKGKYIAQQPFELRVLTALKIDKQNTIVNQGIEVIIPLLEAYQDNDQVIVTNAFSALKNILENEKAQQLLASLIEEPQNQIAREFALAINFTPGNPKQKALFYFLTEQWDKYESLDFEYTLLKTSYQNGTEQLRRLIAQNIKQAGRFEWLKILASENQKKRLGEITDAEWETTVLVLKNGKQWEAMWQLAQKAPGVWSKQLLRGLQEVKWLPNVEQEQVVFDRFKRLADKCSEKIPTPLMEKPTRCQATLNGDTDNIRFDRIIFSPDGKILASSHNQYTRLWRMPDGQPLTTLPKSTDGVMRVIFSPDGKILASSSRDRKIRLWQMSDGQPLATLDGENPNFSPDGKILASNHNQYTRLWRMPDGQFLATLDGHTQYVKGITLSPNGKILASSSRDRKIRLWQMPDGQPLATLNGENPTFSPDGKILASGSIEGTIRLWQMPDGQPLTTLPKSTDTVMRIAFSPDGKILATNSSVKGTIRLWRMPDGQPLATLSKITDGVMRIIFSPDGKILASSSVKGTIRLWQMPDGQPLATLDGNNPTFSPDGQILATDINNSFAMYEEKIMLWQMPDCQPLATLDGNNPTFSPDGQILASFNTFGREVRLWSSDVFKLSRLPIGKLCQHHREWVQETLQDNKITNEEKYSLEFMQALMDWHQRFDVEVEDAPQLIHTGEFDIEIEG